MHRLAVGYDHVLERQLQQLAQRRKDARREPRGIPHAQGSARRRQSVGEDEHTLLRKIDRGFQLPATVLERPQAAWQRVVRERRL
jgi:hypothetical protein